MDRTTVEKRDQEVVEKFRAVVDAKARGKKIVRMRVFVVILVLAVAGAAFSRRYFSSPVMEPVRYASNPVAVTRSPVQEASPLKISDVAVARQGMRGPKGIPVIPETLPGVSPGGGDIAPAPKVLRPDPDLKPFAEAVVGDPDRVLAPRAGLAEKPLSPSVEKSLSSHPHVRIAEMSVCRSVANLRPKSPQKVFSMGKGEKPHVWMDVRARKTPQTLKHIYYHNDQRYCAVNLAINHPRTRTWSNVSLKHPYEAGRWRVDVVSGKGEVISRAEFTVIY